MDLFNKLGVVFLVFASLQASAQSSLSESDFFGQAFKVGKVSTNAAKYEKMAVTDTISMQLKGKIVEVCQAKGCWMKVDLEDGNQVFVRFKDYGFFVPKDVAERTTVLNGVAFLEEMSVEDQRHYAEDKGASEAEIEKITAPKKTLRFEADGVLINE